MHNKEQIGCKIAEACGKCYRTGLDELNSDIDNNKIHNALRRNDEFFKLRNEATKLGCVTANEESRDFIDAVSGLWRAIVDEAVKKS